MSPQNRSSDLRRSKSNVTPVGIVKVIVKCQRPQARVDKRTGRPLDPGRFRGVAGLAASPALKLYCDLPLSKLTVTSVPASTSDSPVTSGSSIMRFVRPVSRSIPDSACFAPPTMTQPRELSQSRAAGRVEGAVAGKPVCSISRLIPRRTRQSRRD